jgi:hypothetical protein
MNKYIIGCIVLLSIIIVCFILLRKRDVNLSSKVMKTVSPYVLLGALQNKGINSICVNVLGDKIPFIINYTSSDDSDGNHNKNLTKDQFEELLNNNVDNIPEDIDIVILYCASWSCGAALNYYNSLVLRNIDVSRVFDYKGALHEWAMYSIIYSNTFYLTNLRSNTKATHPELVQLVKNTMHTYLLNDEKKSEYNTISNLVVDGENIFN